MAGKVEFKNGALVIHSEPSEASVVLPENVYRTFEPHGSGTTFRYYDDHGNSIRREANIQGDEKFFVSCNNAKVPTVTQAKAATKAITEDMRSTSFIDAMADIYKSITDVSRTTYIVPSPNPIRKACELAVRAK